jgi:hypothetical protein
LLDGILFTQNHIRLLSARLSNVVIVNEVVFEPRSIQLLEVDFVNSLTADTFVLETRYVKARIDNSLLYDFSIAMRVLASTSAFGNSLTTCQSRLDFVDLGQVHRLEGASTLMRCTRNSRD